MSCEVKKWHAHEVANTFKPAQPLHMQSYKYMCIYVCTVASTLTSYKPSGKVIIICMHIEKIG